MSKRYRCDKYRYCTNNDCLHYHPHFKKTSCKNSDCEEFPDQKCNVHHVREYMHNKPKKDYNSLNKSGKVETHYDMEGRYSVV